MKRAVVGALLSVLLPAVGWGSLNVLDAAGAGPTLRCAECVVSSGFRTYPAAEAFHVALWSAFAAFTLQGVVSMLLAVALVVALAVRR